MMLRERTRRSFHGRTVSATRHVEFLSDYDLVGILEVVPTDDVRGLHVVTLGDAADGIAAFDCVLTPATCHNGALLFFFAPSVPLFAAGAQNLHLGFI